MTDLNLVGPIKLPTKYGIFKVFGVSEGNLNHAALVMGDQFDDTDVLVRIQSSCLFGETLHAINCDCGQQLQRSMELVNQEGKGIIIHLDQEGRGIGFIDKIHSLGLEQKENIDTVEAFEKLGFAPDERNYCVAINILKELSVKKIRLLTNSPRKIQSLIDAGMEVTRVELKLPNVNPLALSEINTKRDKLDYYSQNSVSEEQTKT